MPELTYDGRHFVLLSTYRAWIDEARYVRVPEGMRTNFASIPWFGRWVISATDQHIVMASLVHDYLTNEFHGERPVIYRADGTIEDNDVSWEQAASIMRHVMKQHGAPGWKRGVVYSALRIYGWWSGR